MSIIQEITYQEYVRREEGLFHAPYSEELEFYQAVQAGNLKKVKQLTNEEAFAAKQGLGVLSPNHLQSLKYHFAITTAMLARYCIDAGMEVSEAFALSDYYIQKVDSLSSADEISNLHVFLCLDYTKRMKKIRKEHAYSVQTKKCLEYIYDHLHTRITVPVLAEYVNLSPNYLSRLFKQETGQTISAYIQGKKIETAQNMLTFSDYTVSEIALTLAFPDQSYFSALFKQYTGITPNTYRKKYYQKRNQTT